MSSRKIQTIILVVGLVLLLFGMRYISSWNGNQRVIKDNVSGAINQPMVAQLVIVPDKYVASQRAYCLDGSNPGYFIRKSSTTSVKNWIIHLPVGGWCTSKEDCFERSKGALGTTRKSHMKHLKFEGMRESNCIRNPDFCNWNVVEFIYCDGGSFAGNVSETIHVEDKPLYLRGAAIFDVLIQHLLDTTKLSQAQHVLLTGSSAGSLAILIHIDHLTELLPQSVLSVKGINDGGIFLDQSVNGQRIMKDILKNTYHLHNIKDTLSLNKCFKEKDDSSKWECFMPEHLYKFVNYPVLFISSYYDTWYLRVSLGLHCVVNSQKCVKEEEETAVEKHLSSVNNLARHILKRQGNGVYITSCQSHSLLKSYFYFNVKSKGFHPSNAVKMWLNTPEKTMNISELESYQISSRNC